MGKKDKHLLIKQAKQKSKKEREIKLKHRKQKTKDLFKMDPAYREFISNFNKGLAVLGLELRDVGGDGNCLFRAVSDQIEGDEVLHDVYRKQACRHMRENQEFYTLYLDEDQDGNLTQYLREMTKDGEWGGNLQLQALSQCFNMNIVIHRKDLQQTVVEPWNQKMDKNKKRFTIHLAYFQEQQFEHYASVRLLGDKSNTESVSSLAKLPNYRHLDMNFQELEKKNKTESKKKNRKEENEEEMLLRLQLEQLGIAYEGPQHAEEEYGYEYEQQEEQEPFPNFPRTKKCKCGSGEQYKNCCFKEYEKRKAMKHKY